MITDYNPAWPSRFVEIAEGLRNQLDTSLVLAIHHIGSTAVPGLAAKDLIDVQMTVAALDAVDHWPDQLPAGLVRRAGITADHVPPSAVADPVQWTKRYWSSRWQVHLHVRERGRSNQRYALLFRDYLRADPAAAGAYGQLKCALAAAAPDDWNAYYAVKEPACDLIIRAAENWAVRVGWTPPESDG